MSFIEKILSKKIEQGVKQELEKRERQRIAEEKAKLLDEIGIIEKEFLELAMSKFPYEKVKQLAPSFPPGSGGSGTPALYGKKYEITESELNVETLLRYKALRLKLDDYGIPNNNWDYASIKIDNMTYEFITNKENINVIIHVSFYK